MNQINQTNQKKGGISKYLNYSVGFLGDAFLYQFMTSFLLVFLTGPAAMSSKDAGTVASTIVLADAFFSIFAGRIIDGLKCKYGRKRPVLLFTAFAMPLCFWLTYLTIGGPDSFKVIYYTCTGFGFYALFVTYYIAFTALGSDIADNYDDSIKMNAYVSFVTSLAALICLALPLPIVEWLENQGVSAQRAWFIFAGAMSIITMAGILLSWNDSRGRERLNGTSSGSQSFREVFSDYRQLLKLKPYRRLIEVKSVLNFCFSIYSSCLVFYISFRIPGDSAMITSLAYTFNTILSFAVIPVLSAFALKFGKRWTTVVGCAIYGVIGLVLYFTGVTTIPALLIYVAGHAIGVAGFWQLYTTNLYDVVDLDEYRNGVRREGNIVGLQSFICTLCISITLRVFTLMMDASGFDVNQPAQTGEALSMLNMTFILFPAITSLIGGLIMYTYKVSKEGNRLVREALERRKNGELQLSSEEIAKIEAMYK